MGMRYSGSGFYEYHKQFRAKAAAYLQQHILKLTGPYETTFCIPTYDYSCCCVINYKLQDQSVSNCKDN